MAGLVAVAVSSMAACGEQPYRAPLSKQEVKAEDSCIPRRVGLVGAPVYMLFVLDGSGSMSSDDKWDAAVRSLGTFFTQVKQRQDPGFGIGLTVFSDDQDGTGGNGPYDGIDIDIAPVDDLHANQLRGRLNSSPSNGTPTREALEGQFPLLEAFQPPPPLPEGGKRVLVLVSDGVPNGGDSAEDECVKITAEYAKKGILTFSVGVGLLPAVNNVYNPEFMSRIAIAGGTQRAGCDPTEKRDGAKMCHYQVTPGASAAALQKQFSDAINAIRGTVATCEFELAPNEKIDPTYLIFTITDESGASFAVAQDDQDGWTVDDVVDPTRVFVHGQTCEMIKANPALDVRFGFGCAPGERIQVPR